MTDLVFTIPSREQVFSVLSQVQQMIERGIESGPVEVRLGRPGKRSLDQNRKLWPMLTDLSKQIEWYGKKLTPEDWKDLMTGSLRQSEAVPGLNGGIVMLGLRTSKMKKAEFAELIEFIYAEGAELGVRWSDKALKAYEEMR